MIGRIDLPELRQDERVEASLRVLNRHSRLEPCYRRKPRVGTEWPEHVGEPIYVPRVRRHDGNDRRHLGLVRVVERLQPDRSTDQRWVAVVPPTPQGVAQNDHGRTGGEFGGLEETSDRRPHA